LAELLLKFVKKLKINYAKQGHSGMALAGSGAKGQAGSGAKGHALENKVSSRESAPHPPGPSAFIDSHPSRHLSWPARYAQQSTNLSLRIWSLGGGMVFQIKQNPKLTDLQG
jgi:hypothetical protein